MNRQNPNIERAKSLILKNQREAEYGKLLTKISDYYHYTKEDRIEIDEAFNADPSGAILALRAQAEHIETEKALGKSPPRPLCLDQNNPR